METKFCRKCGQEKPVSEFIPDTRYRSGYQTYCRDCYNKQHREALEKRKELGFCLSDKERKERQAIADFEQKLGGFKVSILNYAEKGEYKYTVASTKGDFFQTNSKDKFINFIKERV